MPIKKRSINAQGFQEDYVHLKSKYNESGPNNPSHYTNDPTNFNLKSISLEDLDQAVFNEFHNKYTIANKTMPLMLLDAEITSLQNDNYIQFDKEKGFLNLPFFTMYRTENKPLRRTNPGYKQVIYTVPKMKENGIVYEEWITEGPIERILTYELSFITNYREYCNEMEMQMATFFRNKRNIINCGQERFVIGPLSQDVIGETEIINREDIDQRTLYLTTFKLRMWCFTRDLSKMQKRERPNTFNLNIQVNDGVNITTTTDKIDVERYEIDTDKYPTRDDVQNGNYKTYLGINPLPPPDSIV